MAGPDRPISALSDEALPVEKLVLVVVDDDEDIRRSVGRLLRSCGHEVRVFESAEAYLTQDASVDCVIIDIQLPGISGFELEERMRREGRGVSIVFITARDDAATLMAVQKTRWHLLTKPFDDDGLLGAIASARANRG